jgi:molecular chaperone DnaK
MPPVLGIDLGTSNSVVAVCEDGRVTIIADESGEKVQPSAVAFLPDGSVLVGSRAKAGLAQRPERTILSAKRLIGRRLSSDEVAQTRTRMGYEIVAADDGIGIKVDGDIHTLETISALILRHCRDLAETFLGTKADQAVITVPAYFNDNQRNATRRAGEIVGFDVLRIVNEPTAAAFSYGYGGNQTHRIAVYDLGGGTFDVSLLELGEGAIEVLATAGDTFLGGDDFDASIATTLAEGIEAKTGRDPRHDRAARLRLIATAEAAKIELSIAQTTQVELSALAGVPMTMKLRRTDFETAIKPYIDRTLSICQSALTDAALHVSEIDGVVLVGGSTRIPAVAEAVTQFFRRHPDQGIDPDLVVGVGAAVYAATLTAPSQSDRLLLDITPMSLRLATVGGFTEVIISRNAPIPTERTRLFTTAHDDQDRVSLRVYQGEEEQEIDNILLGEFVFSSLPSRRRGDVEIAVTFQLDADGIVQVTARDTETGQVAAGKVNMSIHQRHPTTPAVSLPAPATQ